MRNFLLAAMAVVMVMGISRTATAGELTTNQLLEICELGKQDSDMFCQGYMAGFLQGVQATNIGWENGTKICWPKNITVGQLRKMFNKTANDKPEDLHAPASGFLSWVTAKPFLRSTDTGRCPD
jgi:hypothetical protein